VGPVDESFSQVQLSATTQVLGKRSKDLFESAVADPTLKPPVAGLVRRVAPRQVRPRRPRAKDPEHAIEDVSRIAVRTATPILVERLFLREKRLDQSPLLFGEVHIKVRSEIDPPVDPLPKSDRVSRT
jgi:hypothetical protein